MSERIESVSSPTSTVRIQVTQNTKGFQYETTVSLTWADNHITEAEAVKRLSDLNRQAALIAEREMSMREIAADK